MDSAKAVPQPAAWAKNLRPIMSSFDPSSPGIVEAPQREQTNVKDSG
jgi:hypothetical protein